MGKKLKSFDVIERWADLTGWQYDTVMEALGERKKHILFTYEKGVSFKVALATAMEAEKILGYEKKRLPKRYLYAVSSVFENGIVVTLMGKQTPTLDYIAWFNNDDRDIEHYDLNELIKNITNNWLFEDYTVIRRANDAIGIKDSIIEKVVSEMPEETRDIERKLLERAFNISTIQPFINK